jgi:hypothetical protein
MDKQVPATIRDLSSRRAYELSAFVGGISCAFRVGQVEFEI